MSLILASLAEKKIEDWNLYPKTFEDGEKFARQMDIRLIYDEIKSRGEYTVYKKISFIVLKKNLNARWRSWVLWHEIGHHLLHYPGTYLFTPSAARKVDFEANFVSAIALLPTNLFTIMTHSEIMAEFGYTKKLVEFRQKIWDHFKI